MTSLPSLTALLMFIPMLPLTLFVIWDDIANLKIRNGAVLATLVIFLIVGFATLPWQTVLWHLFYGLIALAITFSMFSVRIMPGGDAKYIAALVPFFMWSDWAFIAILYCVITIGAVIIHKIAKACGLPKVTPNWDSWKDRKRFPFGFPLGVIILTYLGIAAFG